MLMDVDESRRGLHRAGCPADYFIDAQGIVRASPSVPSRRLAAPGDLTAPRRPARLGVGPASPPDSSTRAPWPTPAPIRWGLLGTGNITRKLLIGARQSDEVVVVAVGSRTDERARSFAAANGIGRAHGSYEALLADPEVDAVYISLPNSLHHEWTLASLAAGKHVLCEKPYTRRPAEVERRSMPRTRRPGAPGGLHVAPHAPGAPVLELLPRSDRCAPSGPRSAISSDRTDVRVAAHLDGGSLMDVGCYCVSGSRLIGGEPERVMGEQVLDPNGVERRMLGVMRFPGDVMAIFTCGFDLPTESSRSSAATGDPVLPTHGTPRRGVLYLDDGVIRSSPRTRTGWSSRTWPPPSGVSAAAAGTSRRARQARTIDALYRAASTAARIVRASPAPATASRVDAPVRAGRYRLRLAAR